nr:hypothetical protein [uncultured Sphingomonas sp.]
MEMALSNNFISDLSFDEIDEINGAYSVKEVAEAFLVGAGVGGLVSGGNLLAAAAGGVIGVGILYL